MKAADLPSNERKMLQYGTIIGILVIVYLFFVRQAIITAVLVGAALVVIQKVYLQRRGRK